MDWCDAIGVGRPAPSHGVRRVSGVITCSLATVSRLRWARVTASEPASLDALHAPRPQADSESDHSDGCQRIRLLVKPSNMTDISIADFALETDNCVQGQYKVPALTPDPRCSCRLFPRRSATCQHCALRGLPVRESNLGLMTRGPLLCAPPCLRPTVASPIQASGVCKPYEPGQWCATTTRCEGPADDCGSSEYYCTGDGLRNTVRSGYYSTGPEGARTNQEPCPAGSNCVGGEKTPCGAGTFSASPNATTCRPATRGHFVPDSGNHTSEVPCPAGKYTATGGRNECKDCPDGQYSSVDRSTNCTAADPGFAAGPERRNQSACGTGKYGEDGECKACLRGRYADVRGLAACKPAMPGSKVGGEGSTGQVACEAGEYTESEGQASCKACSAGHYADVQGMAECRPATPGSRVEERGSTRQVACEAGKFSSTAGQAECEDCSDGTYSHSNASVCTAARAGFMVDPEDPTDEVRCAPGAYTDQEGATECIACGLFVWVGGSKPGG